MKASVKWGIAAAVLVGVGVVALGSGASAATGDEPDDGEKKGLQDTGVRHGIRYEGCDHFELVDQDAVEAWGMDHKWELGHWALKLDELKANPEPAIAEAMELMFPECSWPPPSTTTFGPERIGWKEAMVLAKDALAGFDLAVSGGGSEAVAAAMLVQAVALGLRGRSRSGPRSRRRRR